LILVDNDPMVVHFSPTIKDYGIGRDTQVKAVEITGEYIITSCSDAI
jgi:hypothetical protein